MFFNLFVCVNLSIYLFSPHLSPTQVARTGALDIPAAPIIRSSWWELATHLQSSTNWQSQTYMNCGDLIDVTLAVEDANLELPQMLFLKKGRMQSSYWSLPPLAAVVFLCQASAPFCTKNAKFWPVFAIFVANLRTFWCLINVRWCPKIDKYEVWQNADVNRLLRNALL